MFSRKRHKKRVGNLKKLPILLVISLIFSNLAVNKEVIISWLPRAKLQKFFVLQMISAKNLIPSWLKNQLHPQKNRHNVAENVWCQIRKSSPYCSAFILTAIAISNIIIWDACVYNGNICSPKDFPTTGSLRLCHDVLLRWPCSWGWFVSENAQV